ncbi:MAG: hypothetical protein GC179_01055 [Anaerolineaceae bacterium]|nr:hypothetical protein [Anaerolineaceae bacterium]
MKRFGMLLFILLMLPVTLIQAQESPLPLPLAVEYQDKLYLMTSVPRSAEDIPAALTLIGDQTDQYYGAEWSPDGTKLLYGSKNVWDGSQTIQLSVGIPSGVPKSWTHDGQVLVVKFLDHDPASAIDYTVQVYTIAPEPTAKPKLIIDKMPVQEGCGIGTELPMENRLWHEVGIGNLRPLWVLTDYGLVYPAQCDGAISLYRPATGENFMLANGNLMRAVLSPDGSRLAGIVYNPDSQLGKIVVVDLMTLAEITLETIEPASVVAWGNDGSLYYVAMNKTRNLMDKLPSEKVAEVLSLMHQSSVSDFTRANIIRLYRRAPDGTETLLHKQDAYAVGKLIFKDNTLIYSTIANGDPWIQALADGTLTGENVFFGTAYNYTSTAVNYITFNTDGSVAQTGTLPGDLQRVAVPK